MIGPDGEGYRPTLFHRLLTLVEIVVAVAGLYVSYKTGAKMNAKANADVRASWAQDDMAKSLRVLSHRDRCAP